MAKSAKRAISKDAFVDLFAAFAKDKGIVVVDKEGKESKAKGTYWSLFRDFIAFLFAATAASGKISLAGVGKFEFIVTGKGEKEHPVFRYRPSSLYKDLFTANADVIDFDGVLTPEEMVARVAKVQALIIDSKHDSDASKMLVSDSDSVKQAPVL